jgi:hypothetical protein
MSRPIGGRELSFIYTRRLCNAMQRTLPCGRMLTLSNLLEDANEFLIVLSVNFSQVDALEITFLLLSVSIQVTKEVMGIEPATLCCETPICRYPARHHNDNDDSRIGAVLRHS